MSKRYWEDFNLGFFGTFGPRTVTREEIIEFAQEFDPQPMHLDDTAANNSMLGGLAASGWHSCALLTRMMVDGFVLDSISMGAPGIEEVRWLQPLRPGNRLTLRATVTAKRTSKSRPDIGLVNFTFELLNQHGACVMTLKNTQMFKRRHPGAQASQHARPNEVGA